MAYILIIEDDDDIRDYVEQVLSNNGFSILSAGSGSKAWQLVEDKQPDLVLVDLGLPDISGESLVKRLAAEYPNIAVIVLTAKDSPSDVARGLEMGADDYLGKPFSAEELVARIRARLGKAQVAEVLVVGELRMDTRSHEVEWDGAAIELSAQEFRLLEYLMRHPGQVLSRDMILSRIWGTTADVETRVVDVYVGYLRKKLEVVGGDEEMIKTVRGFGYMLKGED